MLYILKLLVKPESVRIWANCR